MPLPHHTMNYIGARVDSLFLMMPKLLAPFRPKRAIDADTYEQQINFYYDRGFVEAPETFFTFPETAPAYEKIHEAGYGDGKYQVYQFSSGYIPQNPMIRDEYLGFAENRSGYLVRWTHGDAGRKTVLCLHGYMLGEPKQAEKMFKVDRLYQKGLDVALFITPFHWKRAPQAKSLRGIFLQPDDVVMTCECFGQAMYDLSATMQILAALGAGSVGIIGASLGGYNAALFACLSRAPAFCAMMVPAVDFSRPFGPDTARLPFKASPSLQAKMNQVWQLHSPLHFHPRLPLENILIVASEGDRLCPFAHVKALCEKWGWPRHQFMTGGHWLTARPADRGRAWYGFLADMGFIASR